MQISLAEKSCTVRQLRDRREHRKAAACCSKDRGNDRLVEIDRDEIGVGVFASLAAVFDLIVAPAIGRGDDDVRRGAILSILIWFVIDSAGSIAAGVPSNAAFNVVFLALFLAPLMAAKGAARSRAQAA